MILWLARDVSLISPLALQALSQDRIAGTLAIADITLSEIAQLVSKGRVQLDRPVSAYLRFLEANLTILPITAAIAEQAHNFSKDYPRDPADRLIGATALLQGAPLITADRLIRASGEVPCIW